MEYRLPVVLNAPDGTVILTDEGVVNKMPENWETRIRDIDNVLRAIGKDRVDVAVTVHNDPSSFVRCVDGIVSCELDVDYDLTVFARWCDPFTMQTVVEKCKEIGARLVVVEEHELALTDIEIVMKHTTGRWVFMVDQRVRVTRMFLVKMMGALLESKASMVVPFSSKILPFPAGHNYKSTAAKVNATSRIKAPQIAFPGSFCVGIERRAYDTVEGINTNGFGKTYGSFADFYMRLLEQGMFAVRADDVLVLDKSPGKTEALEWVPGESAGYRQFMAKWGDKAVKVFNKRTRDSLKDVATAMVHASVKERRKVVFVFKDIHLCGLVLAVTHICNELIEEGFDASFACERMELKHSKHIPMNFTPYVFGDTQRLVRGLRDELEHATVISTICKTVQTVVDICKDKDYLYPVNFVQDDERKFRDKFDQPYHNPDMVEKSWAKIENTVVNSDWVQEELAAADVVADKIGIGVDTMMFYPGNKNNSTMKIMAHCRPKTPRRGWPFIVEVLNKVSACRDVEIITYDEDPEGLVASWRGHLGRISPMELAFHMNRANIFLEGSERQAWGMQALEAMSSGCALVTTDNYGIDNYGTSGHDCIVIPHGDVDRTVAIICHLVDNKDDRRALGINARATAVNFDWKNIVKAWGEFLRGAR